MSALLGLLERVAFLLMYNMLVNSIYLARFSKDKLMYTIILNFIDFFMKVLSILEALSLVGKVSEGAVIFMF